MENKLIKITLGIPTYQRLNYLQEAVRSAQAQTYSNIEILICDDGEQPAIQNWCETLSSEDSRVRYVKNAYRRGLAGNWNSILENATGDYIGIIGDDDRYLPNFVERLLQGIQKGADIVFSSHYLIDDQGLRLESETQESERRYSRDQMLEGFLEDPAYWIWLNAIPMSSALFKRLSDGLCFDESLNTPEILFYLKRAQKKERFFYIPDFLLEFRVHPQSSTFSGLWTEKLIDRLIEFPSSEAHLPFKNKMIASMIVNAVGRSIIERDRSRAQRLMSSFYYQESGAGVATRCVQSICSRLPSFVGGELYQGIHQLKCWSSRLRTGKK